MRKPCQCKYSEEFITVMKEGFTCNHKYRAGALCKICTGNKCRKCSVMCELYEVRADDN